jgi:hypothetical protein
MMHVRRTIGGGIGVLARYSSRPALLLVLALLALVIASVSLTSVQSLWSKNLVIEGQVQIREVRSQLTPTGTDCADFRDNTAADQSELQYGVKLGKISEIGEVNGVNPGVFFYFTYASITDTTGTADEVSIDQTGTALPEIEIKDISVYYGPGCDVQSRPTCANGATDCAFEIGETGDFIVRVRYNSQSLKGTGVCPGLPTSTHTYATGVDGVETTQDSLDVSPKPTESC